MQQLVRLSFAAVRLADRDLRFAQIGRGHVVGRIDTARWLWRIAGHDRRISARCSSSTPTGMTMREVRKPLGNTDPRADVVRAPRIELPGRCPAAGQWLWFIPLGRPSSAKGYAQAQDPVWNEYQAPPGTSVPQPRDMEDALDFIGWYDHRTRRQLGIPLTDAQRLYLAYHEGQGGYRRGTWRDKPKVQSAARRVAAIGGSLQSAACAL